MYSYVQQGDDTILVSHSGELTKPIYLFCGVYSIQDEGNNLLGEAHGRGPISAKYAHTQTFLLGLVNPQLVQYSFQGAEARWVHNSLPHSVLSPIVSRLVTSVQCTVYIGVGNGGTGQAMA